MKIPQTLLEETLASGQSRFENKVAWVRQYLVLAGYIDRSRRGVWSLTEKGRTSGTLSDEEIHQLLLDIQRRGKNASTNAATAADDTAEEDSEGAVPEDQAANGGYKSSLLSLLLELPASGFERLCQLLLRESGFEQVIVTGRSGDGGIDGHGILRVNPFVTFKVLFQCKKYAGSVGARHVRDFHGAMLGRADKGIILTTGSFSRDAYREATRDGVPPIELVDGEHLVALFEQLELGLTPRTTYDIDYKFFEQYQDPCE
jgi:restriction system protein